MVNNGWVPAGGRRPVQWGLAIACLLLVAGCQPAQPANVTATQPGGSVTSAPVSPPGQSSTPATPTPTDRPAVLPNLVGSTLAQAQTALTARGLRWKTSYRASRLQPGTVITQSRKDGTAIPPGTVIVLVIASAPPPPPLPPPPLPPPPPPPPAVPASNCDPSYPEVCLHDGIGDYDCAGGSGNGPNYVDGPIKVLPPDPFDLDRDGDGTGCE